ncbi:MAG: MXAN_6640 family putative metalloprotease [Bacteroidota bacterium]
MKKHIIFLLATFSANLFAQNLDSLYNAFLSARSPQQITGYQVTSEGEHEKCLTGLVYEVKRNFDLFNPKQKIVLSSLLSRPTTDTSIVTPSGFFKIHFNKSGVNKPGYDVDELAVAFDSSYNYEVNILGYPPPPDDNGEGGDNKYDIYVTNLTNGNYGYTEPETDITSERSTSFIVMDNDFAGYFTEGIYAAQVTAAHELHHAIQMGKYIFRSSDQYYMEATSTAMEEFVFDSVNDYYGYIHTFTNRPERTFAASAGYDLAPWNIFLKDRFDYGIIKRIWELMPDKRALEAMVQAIADSGSTFKEEFNLFGQWFYFTGSRAVPGKYFEESANYPQIEQLISTEFIKPVTSVTIDSEPVSLNYLLFTSSGTAVPDSFVAVVANCDVTNAVSSSTTKLNFKYSLSDGGDGYTKIVDGYYSKIESSSPFLLAESDILNNVALNDGTINTVEIGYPYPQPFRYSINPYVYFPVGRTFSGYADLYVYSIDVNLVFSGQVRIISSDKITAQWNALDSENKKLGTGIYFYVIKVDDQTHKGKFAVFND